MLATEKMENKYLGKYLDIKFISCRFVPYLIPERNEIAN
jgi:hypothetical protein